MSQETKETYRKLSTEELFAFVKANPQRQTKQYYFDTLVYKLPEYDPYLKRSTPK